MTAKNLSSLRGRYHAVFAQLCQQFDYPKTSQGRHQLTEWILGEPKSSSKFESLDYCLILDQMDEWIRGDIEPHPLPKKVINDQYFQQIQKRLIWKIEKVAYSADLNNAYIQSVADDTIRSAKRPWRDHGTVQLKKLRFTITRAAAAKIKKAKDHG